MKKIVLADRYDAIDVIKEEKEQWVITMLVMLGVPEEQIDEDRAEILMDYGIRVWNHLDNGDVEIIQNNVLVGKWYVPELTPKYDETGRIYYEICIDTDSVLNNTIYSGSGDE